MFILFTLPFFILGIFYAFKPRHAIFLFFLLAATIPSSSAFETLVSKFGIYFYEPFLFVTIVICLIKKPTAQFNRKFTPQLFSFFVLTCYIAIGLVVYGADKYLIREFRVILCIALPFFMIPALHRVKITETAIVNTVIVASIIHAITFAAYYNNLLQVNNVYYSEENRYRYSGFTTYLCTAFLLYGALNSKNFTNKLLYRTAMILSITVILIAGSRIMIAGLVLSLLFASSRSPKKLIYSLFIGTITVLVFIYIAQILNIDRLNGTASVETIIAQLGIRLHPAKIYLDQSNTFNYLFGHALGATFEIPWFDYQNLDTKHNTIDSAYPTLWVKLGAFSLVYIYALLKTATYEQDIRTKKAIATFIAITMLTTSIPYQPIFSIFILFALTLSRLEGRKIEEKS